MEGGFLRISAEKSDAKDEERVDDKGHKYHRIERSSGSMYRNIKLPGNADVDAVTAKAENGVLSVSIGKRAKAAAGGKKILIE